MSARILVVAALAVSSLAAQETYRRPPEPIPTILLAADPPSVSLVPDQRHLLLVRREPMPSIATVARPRLKLAGLRIDPHTHGPQLGTRITSLALRTLEDATETPIAIAGAGHLGTPVFSADGARFALTNTRDDFIELWVGETATAKATRVPDVVLSHVLLAPLRWMPEQKTLLCALRVPGNAPPAPRAPSGPVVALTSGKKAPVRTYQDLLQDEHDATLFEHYATVQLALVDTMTLAVTKIGAPAIIDDASPSPDGQFLLVQRVHRPFSFHVPSAQFPTEIAVWKVHGDHDGEKGGDKPGEKLAVVVDRPLADTTPIGGVVTGPRGVAWVPTSEHALYWLEALDGGDPKQKVAARDRVVVADAPGASPKTWFTTEHRCQGVQFGEDGATVLATEFERQRRWSRTWRYDAKQRDGKGTLLYERSTQDAYGDPGRPVVRTDARGRALLRMEGGAVFLSGQGASPAGDRPFLDRWDLASGDKKRLFSSGAGVHETFLAFVGAAHDRVLITSESPATPPNTWLVELSTGKRTAITADDDPAHRYLAGVKKERVQYPRNDGVPLSGTLYLPADHQAGQKLPLLIWAYPREYNQASDAGQVRGSLNRYTRMGGASHLFLVLCGYAVLDEAAMPIVGPVETANDTFLPQLVANAEAAVGAMVARGVADRDRVAIAGHSYGAFMTANLLAHSDLFRTGIARSGAYNRTLTPFGFQNEERTLWEAPTIYAEVSPFMAAHKVNEPILLIHGEDDNNPGTFPVQSQRFFAALQGHGATARLVMLPHESHGYRAQESVLHTLAETVEWLDRWVKHAPLRGQGG
jgi:dipeptidyl aminopeptidase/acylaminoacyl peptidase